MNNNKNIKLNSISKHSTTLANKYNNNNMDNTDLIVNNNSNNDVNMDPSQLVPAHTHTMTINLRDEDGNIVPTTVTLNFFFTSHNPNDVPIYAEFTKLDNNNNPIYKTNFSFTGVEDMGLPIAAAILHGSRLSNSISDNDSDNSENDEDEQPQTIEICMEDVFKNTITHCRSKALIKKTLNEHFLINKFNSSMSFDDIFTYTIKVCNSLEGLGLITFYDITNDICSFYKINIPNIYIIRSGTKKAITALNISKSQYKTAKFNNLSVKYISVEDIKQSLKHNNYQLSFESNNGALYEEYLNNLSK